MTHIPELVANILWERAIIGLAEVSENGKILQANPTLCEMLEYSPSELTHLALKDVFHPEDLYDNLEMMDKVLKRDISGYVMSVRLITKSDRIIWVKFRLDSVGDNSQGVKLLLSQYSSPKEIFKGREKELRIEVVSSVKGMILSFLKTNWKWLLGTLFAGIAAALAVRDVWLDTQDRLERIERAIEDKK